MQPWSPDRAAALERLESFLPRAGRDYARLRNSDLGPGRRDNVSLLSPWLRYRVLTEREVLARVLAEHDAAAADKFIQEVLWRTYWKGWLELRPGVWQAFVDERQQSLERCESDLALAASVAAAESGQTGIEGFDHWARELVKTGYLHNHARMWFASIWIFTLRLPWVLGADFFLRHLLDADPASNTLSWRWVAGLQTPGKTYLARADNIEKYTDGRFRPSGLATRAEPLKGRPTPAPRALPPALAEAGLDLSGKALLVHPEDLEPESLIEQAGRPALILLAGPDAFAPAWPWGDKAQSFLRGTMDDLAGRLEGQAPVERLDCLEDEELLERARSHGAQSVITPCAPTGPIADVLGPLEHTLAGQGIEFKTVRRDWDEAAWPLAKRGFFPFRKHIPALLKRAGLE